jgi:hypothetical protein
MPTKPKTFRGLRLGMFAYSDIRVLEFLDETGFCNIDPRMRTAFLNEHVSGRVLRKCYKSLNDVLPLNLVEEISIVDHIS